MSAQAGIALLVLLLFSLLSVRDFLRSRCLGRCAGCPCAKTCEAAKAVSHQQA